jgi:hypothetical protein
LAGGRNGWRGRTGKDREAGGEEDAARAVGAKKMGKKLRKKRPGEKGKRQRKKLGRKAGKQLGNRMRWG